jgi:hypothetical protein
MHAWLQLCILQKRKRKSLLTQARCMPNNAFVYKNYNFNGIFQILLLEIVIERLIAQADLGYFFLFYSFHILHNAIQQ